MCTINSAFSLSITYVNQSVYGEILRASAGDPVQSQIRRLPPDRAGASLSWLPVLILELGRWFVDERDNYAILMGNIHICDNNERFMR